MCSTYIVMGDEFDEPIALDWMSLDGRQHHARVDLSEIFMDRRVLHQVREEEVAEGWLASGGVEPGGVEVILELNDRTARIFMRAMVATKEPQKPGNPFSHFRKDLIQAWTRSY